MQRHTTLPCAMTQALHTLHVARSGTISPFGFFCAFLRCCSTDGRLVRWSCGGWPTAAGHHLTSHGEAICRTARPVIHWSRLAWREKRGEGGWGCWATAAALPIKWFA